MISYPDFDIFTLFSFDTSLYKFCDHRDIDIIKKKMLRQSFFDSSFATQEELYHKAF